MSGRSIEDPLLLRNRAVARQGLRVHRLGAGAYNGPIWSTPTSSSILCGSAHPSIGIFTVNRMLDYSKTNNRTGAWAIYQIRN